MNDQAAIIGSGSSLSIDSCQRIRQQLVHARIACPSMHIVDVYLFSVGAEMAFHKKSYKVSERLVSNIPSA